MALYIILLKINFLLFHLSFFLNFIFILYYKIIQLLNQFNNKYYYQILFIN